MTEISALKKYKNSITDKNPDVLSSSSQNHRKFFSSLSFSGKINFIVKLGIQSISPKEFSKTVKSYLPSESDFFELFRDLTKYTSELETKKEDLEACFYDKKSDRKVTQNKLRKNGNTTK